MDEVRQDVTIEADSEGYAVLSNGSKIYVGKSPIDEIGRWNIDYLERMISAGHRPRVDEDGSVDMFFTSGGYCNGPGCEDCGETACMHCRPEWQPDPCIGKDGAEQRDRERRYADFLKLKQEFESSPSAHPTLPEQLPEAGITIGEEG